MVRVYLGIYTLLFLGFGVFVFFQAPELAANVGFGTPDSNGLYEVRSNYGGVSLGIGLMCFAGALRPTLQRPALFVLLAYTGGYALGRIIALPIDGVPSASLIAYGVFEAVTAILSAVLLRKLV